MPGFGAARDDDVLAFVDDEDDVAPSLEFEDGDPVSSFISTILCVCVC